MKRRMYTGMAFTIWEMGSRVCCEDEEMGMRFIRVIADEYDSLKIYYREFCDYQARQLRLR